MAASSTPGAGAAGLALKDLSSLRQQFPPAGCCRLCSCSIASNLHHGCLHSSLLLDPHDILASHSSLAKAAPAGQDLANRQSHL